MTCDGCSIKFTVFKRRRQCSICQRYYCSCCLPFGQNSSSKGVTSMFTRFTDKKIKCSKCEVLTARPLCRSQLRELRVKDLQLYLTSQKVSTRGCVEKDDLVNLLMRHAGHSSTNTQRTDFPYGHSGQADTQSRVQSSMVQDQRNHHFQEQGTSTAACLSAQCSPSTSETLPDNGYLDSAVTSEERTNTGSAASASVSCSDSGPQSEHQAPPAANMFISHEDNSSISSSSSSSSAQSSSGCFGEQSVANIDIVELTDGAGDISNLDAGPEPVITIVDDESPERTFSEESHVTVSEVLADIGIATDAPPASSCVEDGLTVLEIEVLETDETADVVVEGQDEYHDPAADVPLDETSDSATEEHVITQACTGITLASIRSLEDLEKLTVKQLKELLSLNRVDYRGCCEKPELMERVTRLWQESSQTRKGLDTMSMDELCKICMDAPVECVMLECGHMATCTACGKQLSECPICRQFVVRIVRTFRA
ncbi:hypothetical protein B7P43_G04140 [Cryptotermes secundus]|nr:E3 ubiquitin-protein ligase RNF34 isoform X2 [Cryptotermes secundus]PNF39097.1 hypothetical protein B7P43_G04140 [Cryptotermes secundus]